MNKNNFRITVISLPDRENIVSEIFYKGEQWVEISQETGELLIQFYNSNKGDHWEFSFDEAFNVLEKAKKRLLQEGE